MTINLADVVRMAQSQLGVPYVAFTERPGKSFDCSGLTQWVYKQFGINVPQQSNLQYEVLARQGGLVPYAQAQPGDLVFFRGSHPHPPEMIGHVALYIGNGMMIEAPGTGLRVRVHAVYSTHFPVVGRPPTFFNAVGANGIPIPPASAQPPMGTMGRSVPLPASAGSGAAGNLPLGTGVPLGAPTQAASDPLTFAYQNYGYLNAFVKDPEIGGILMSAAQKSLGINLLLAQLQATNWWQTHSASQRTFLATQQTDPATAKAQVAARAADIQNLAGTYGVAIDPAEMQNLAEWAVANSLSSTELTNAIVAKAKAGPHGFTSGTLGAAQLALAGAAQDYALRYPTSTLSSWANDIVRGAATMDGVKQQMANSAKASFASNPTLLAAINNGGTVRGTLGKQIEMIAGELQISPDVIDLTDNTWARLLNTPSEKPGINAPASIDEARVLAREQPDYLKTSGAAQKISTGGMGILKTLGLAGV